MEVWAVAGGVVKSLVIVSLASSSSWSSSPSTDRMFVEQQNKSDTMRGWTFWSRFGRVALIPCRPLLLLLRFPRTLSLFFFFFLFCLECRDRFASTNRMGVCWA